MSLATRNHRLTFVINSTVVDDDTLRRISEQLQKLLNDPDDLPLPEVSTTTVFQTMPTTIIVKEIQTSVVTATVTAARTISEVPFTTFRPSQGNNNLLTTTPTETSSSPVTSASSPTPLLASTTSTIFASAISTDLSSTTSTLSPPTKKSLPPGAIIGIVIICMTFFLFLVIYFIRWRLRRKREGSRKWITPFVVEKPVVHPSVTRRQEKRMEFLVERWQRMRNSRRNRGATNAGNSSSGPNNAAGRKTRDGEQVSAPPVAYRGPSAGRPVQDSLLVSSVFPNGAVAKLRFEPRKQDELRALPGDYLKVLTLFDDGWALCRNSRGEKGMVPTTCLRANRLGRMGNG